MAVIINYLLETLDIETIKASISLSKEGSPLGLIRIEHKLL